MNTDSASPPLKHKRILITNDDVTQLSIISALVRKEGITAIPCKSVDEALAILGKDSGIDLIITDLHMPGIDGWKFCRLLKSPEYMQFNTIPIFVISATFSGEYARQITVDLGANAFLPSPFHASTFREHLKAIFSGEAVAPSTVVLIIEDSRSLSVFLRNVFESHGYKVHTSLTGKEGKDLFYRYLPDLVILDYHLPDLLGDTLIEEFKKVNPPAVIVMMTMDPTPELASGFLRKGATAYVRKPFDPDYLITLCDHARRERAFMRVEDRLEERTQELRESEKKYKSVITNIQDIFYRTDTEGKLIMTNPSAARILGYHSIEDMLGLPFGSFWSRSDEREKIIEQLGIHGKVNDFESSLKKRDGSVISVSVSCRHFTNDGGMVQGEEGIIRDISDRKRLEHELIRAKKLESVGILAGGIAHDFNNILTAILGNIELAKFSLSPETHGFQKLSQAEKACEIARDLANRLLIFSRGYDPVREILDFADLFDDAADILMKYPKIELVRDLPRGLPAISADSDQIRQVLRNIILNAVEAMPSGGVISVRAECHSVGHGDIVNLNKGNYIKVTISDEGRGILAEDIPMVFDPYFTTKEMGSVKGMGLGLTICHSIMQKHDGLIAVESQKNKGTTFTLYFPVAAR